ncbi:MAG TPA: peptidoglycan-binding protein, partial [Archangium sp.]
MTSKISKREPVAAPPKLESTPKVSKPSAPPPPSPTAWTAPSDTPSDGWKGGTPPRPSIAPPPPALVSDAPVLSARAFATAHPSPSRSPHVTRVLKNGVSGEDVKQLQAALSEAGFSVSRSGRYDAATERAVRNFQRSRDLKVDGDAGRNTLRALGFTFGASASSGPVLKRGMQGEDVSTLQQQLRDAGQHVRVTGSYDAATERAVEGFQRARGLQVDGDAGPETLTALRSTP